MAKLTDLGLSKERERERECGNRGSDKRMTSSRPSPGRRWQVVKALNVRPWRYDLIRLRDDKLHLGFRVV